MFVSRYVSIKYLDRVVGSVLSTADFYVIQKNSISKFKYRIYLKKQNQVKIINLTNDTIITKTLMKFQIISLIIFSIHFVTIHY